MSESDRSPTLRDALLAFIGVHASAAELRTSEVLLALHEAFAVLLVQLVVEEGKSPDQRKAVYQRAADFLVACCLDLDQDGTAHTQALLRKRRQKKG